MKRRDFFKNVLTGAVSASAGIGLLRCSGESESQKVIPYEKPPNIILIFADDLGYGDLSIYGHPTIKTPNIDSLGKQGVRFTRVQFPQNYEIEEPVPGIPHNQITIAESLKPLGYATHIIGKWHLGDLPEFHPTRHGFDHFYGVPYSNDMDPLYLYRDEEKQLDGENLFKNDKQGLLTELYTEEAVRFIRESQNRPFFLYYATTFPHEPLYATERFAGKSEAGLYGDTIECVDWSVGEIIKTVDELGLAENTLIVFTSDNGALLRIGTPESNGGLRGQKSTVFEGGIREPMLARWTGRIPSGSVCTDPAITMDLFTTFIEIAGGEIPQDRAIDGKNIMPLLDGSGKVPHEELFFYQDDVLCAARFGNWKLHVDRLRWRGRRNEGRFPNFQGTELYDLENDPNETTNLAEQYSDLVGQLTARIKEVEKEFKEEYEAEI